MFWLDNTVSGCRKSIDVYRNLCTKLRFEEQALVATQSKLSRLTRQAGQQGRQANKAGRPTRQAGQQGRQANKTVKPIDLKRITRYKLGIVRVGHF